MTRIIFVCHGNICRSAMAEFIMKHIIEEAGRASEFQITSAAVSYEEQGNDMYPPAKANLRQHHIPFTRHAAHRITQEEFHQADLIILMDQSNWRLLERIVGSKALQEGSSLTPSGKKVCKMMEFGGYGQDVADPWYTGDFEQTYQDINLGCHQLASLL